VATPTPPSTATTPWPISPKTSPSKAPTRWPPNFKANPEKYAPQYGGYCAYGVTQGYLVKVDPEQFSVIDGKLYLNYDADVQAKWKKDTAGYITSANAKFPALLKK
jgi:hypothetical protein